MTLHQIRCAIAFSTATVRERFARTGPLADARGTESRGDLLALFEMWRMASARGRHSMHRRAARWRSRKRVAVRGLAKLLPRGTRLDLSAFCRHSPILPTDRATSMSPDRAANRDGRRGVAHAANWATRHFFVQSQPRATTIRGSAVLALCSVDASGAGPSNLVGG